MFKVGSRGSSKPVSTPFGCDGRPPKDCSRGEAPKLCTTQGHRLPACLPDPAAPMHSVAIRSACCVALQQLREGCPPAARSAFSASSAAPPGGPRSTGAPSRASPEGARWGPPAPHTGDTARLAFLGSAAHAPPGPAALFLPCKRQNKCDAASSLGKRPGSGGSPP